jgi:hypothetical protein
MQRLLAPRSAFAARRFTAMSGRQVATREGRRLGGGGRTNSPGRRAHLSVPEAGKALHAPAAPFSGD